MATTAGTIERALTSRTDAVAMDFVLGVLNSNLLRQKGYRSFRCAVGGCNKCSVEVWSNMAYQAYLHRPLVLLDP